MSAREYRRLMLRLTYLSAIVMVAGIFLATKGIALAGYVATGVVAAIWLVNGAAFVRRIHDRNRTGWWIVMAVAASFLALYLEQMQRAGGPVSTSILLFQLGTVLASFWFLIELYVLKGTAGPNRFGPDPRDGA